MSVVMVLVHVKSMFTLLCTVSIVCGIVHFYLCLKLLENGGTYWNIIGVDRRIFG